MKPCIKCGRRSAKIKIAHLPGGVCNDCLIRIVEKRVRKGVRLEGWLLGAKRIMLLDDGSANSAVCRYFAGELTQHSGIEVATKKIASINSVYPAGIKKLVKGKAVRVVLPWNAEQESELLLGAMVGSKGFVRDDSRVVKLLRHVSGKEVEVFAHLKGLKYGKRSNAAEPKLKEFLDGLEKDSPDLRFALIRAFEKLE